MNKNKSRKSNNQDTNKNGTNKTHPNKGCNSKPTSGRKDQEVDKKYSDNANKSDGRRIADDNENKVGGKPTGDRQEPFWYAKDEDAIKDLASIPFLEVVGDDVPGATADTVPAVMTVEYKHTVPGSAVFSVDGYEKANYATRAADAYFQYVTQGYTSSVGFESPDLLMTAMAGNSLIAAVIEGKRAYGVCHYYLQQNKAYAKGVIEALGFNFDDFKTNLADFRSQLNIFIDSFNDVVAVPKDFFIGDRWEFIASNIFTDTDSPEYSTAMAYVSRGYLLYDPIHQKNGTCLRWLDPQAGGKITKKLYFQYLDQMLEALKDSDTRSIFGAIRRVYEDGDLKKLTPLDEDFVLPIVRNDIVAASLHNLKCEGTAVYGVVPIGTEVNLNPKTYDFACFQSASGAIQSVICTPTQPKMSSANNGHWVLDMYDHQVSPGNILDITTNMQVTEYDGAVSASAYELPGTSPSDMYAIISRCEVITAVKLKYYTSSNTEIQSATVPLVLTTSDITNRLPTLARLSHVDSHPLVLIVSSNGTPQQWFGEIDKYTSISIRVLAKMHNRSAYQLLSLPRNSKSVTH